MARLRKQRRKKVYRHNVNRKRMRNRLFAVGDIECTEIKKAWNKHKSVKINMKEMGLSYDPNETIKPPDTASIENRDDLIQTAETTKGYVAQALEKDAKAPRVKLFRLPNSQVEWITYLMSKYGTDYDAMVRDKKNYNQETWRQLRAKINRFKSIPEQYTKYLREKGLVDD